MLVQQNLASSGIIWKSLKEVTATMNVQDPFREIRANARHPRNSRLIVVLEAVTQVILQRRGEEADPGTNGDPSPTEYFAALMTALEGSDMDNMEDLLTLLAIALRFTPAAPLKTKFKHILSVFTFVAKQIRGTLNRFIPLFTTQSRSTLLLDTLLCALPKIQLGILMDVLP